MSKEETRLRIAVYWTLCDHLNQLIAQGDGKSMEADDLRGEIDDLWCKMNNGERDQLNHEDA